MRDGSLLERLDSSDVAHVQDRMAYLLSLRERLEARRNGVQLQRAALQQRARAVQEDVAGLASDVTALSRALEGRRAMLDNFRRRADELDQLSETVARTASALSAELHNDDHWARPLSHVQRETGRLDESATAAELAAAAERMRRRGLERRPADDSIFRRLQVQPPRSPSLHPTASMRGVRTGATTYQATGRHGRTLRARVAPPRATPHRPSRRLLRMPRADGARRPATESCAHALLVI